MGDVIGAGDPARPDQHQGHESIYPQAWQEPADQQQGEGAVPAVRPPITHPAPPEGHQPPAVPSQALGTQQVHHGVMDVPVDTNHTFHLLFTVFTCGLWLPVWLIVWAVNTGRRKKVLTYGANLGPVSAGRWAADPTGRHEARWWDGQAWTGRVADAGRESTDPL
jgi:hypothetical protein